MTTTCNHELRTGPCALDAEHRGRHTTSAFRCDLCDKTRRGVPFAVEEVRLGDGTVDDRFEACFMCARGIA